MQSSKMVKSNKIRILGAALLLAAAPIASADAGNWHALTAHSAASGLYHPAANQSNNIQASRFIENMGQEAITFLGDDSIDTIDKQQRFRTLLNNSFDMETIGRFSLGRQWRALDEQQRQEYQALFEEMIVMIYTARFSDYRGEGFIVDSAQPSENNDYVVRSYIVPRNGGRNIAVDWRVRLRNGQHRIVDVSVEGVSMALTQRSDFASIIQRGGGDPEALLDHLRSRIQL